MSTNFMRFNSASLQVQRQHGDPECFGISWDSDEPACRYDCEVYSRCGRELARLDAIKRHKKVGTAVAVQSSGSSRVGAYQTGESKITRPKIPSDMPPGTEYLPPELAGRNTALERGAAIAFSEGLAAGIGQFFTSCASFARDITAWHPHAGRWKYGKNFRKDREGPDKD